MSLFFLIKYCLYSVLRLARSSTGASRLLQRLDDDEAPALSTAGGGALGGR